MTVIPLDHEREVAFARRRILHYLANLERVGGLDQELIHSLHSIPDDEPGMLLASDLKMIVAEVERLTAKLEKLEQQDLRNSEHLGYAASNIERLTAELGQTTATLAQVESENADLLAERDQLRADLKATQGNRLVSAIFGHHKGAPKPFALYRRSGRGVVALGAEFPDGAAALRLANDGGWTTTSEGGAEHYRKADIEIVWLSDELEPLSAMEQQRDDAQGFLADLLNQREAMYALISKSDGWLSVNEVGAILNGEGVSVCVCPPPAHAGLGQPVELHADDSCSVHGEQLDPVREEAEAGRLDAEGLAQLFHETYERLAPDHGYRTREASAKPWSEVPEANRGLMVATCAEILRALVEVEDAPQPQDRPKLPLVNKHPARRPSLDTHALDEPWALDVSCPGCGAPEKVWCFDAFRGGHTIGHVHDERRERARASAVDRDGEVERPLPDAIEGCTCPIDATPLAGGTWKHERNVQADCPVHAKDLAE